MFRLKTKLLYALLINQVVHNITPCKKGRWIMEYAELIKSVGGAGILVALSVAWIYKALYQDPKEKEKQSSLIERVSTVIANNTEVIRETKVIHREMEKTLIDIRTDIQELKNSTDLTSVYAMLEKLESKIDKLGK